MIAEKLQKIFSMEEREPQSDGFAEQLAHHVSERKRAREEAVCSDFTRFAPSRKCKWGKNCREIDVCSYYHGDGLSWATQFCSCDSIDCPKPHPKRAKKVARRKINRDSSSSQSSSQQLVCKKCGGPHRVTECPDVQCFKCKRWGHMPGSYECPMK